MDEAKEYLNSLNADKANIKQLIYQYNQAIAQSKTTEEVQTLRDAFDKAYLKLMIENIKEDINQFVSHLDYNDKEKELVKTKKEALFISIEKLNDIKEVELEVTTFKNEIQKRYRKAFPTDYLYKRRKAYSPFRCAFLRRIENKSMCKGNRYKNHGREIIAFGDIGCSGDNSCCSVLCGVALQCAGYFCRAVCGFCGDMVCARHYTHAHI